MSKASQRKCSMYQQGYQDGVNGCGCRWKRHPLKEHYIAGLIDGRAANKNKKLAKEAGL